MLTLLHILASVSLSIVLSANAFAGETVKARLTQLIQNEEKRQHIHSVNSFDYDFKKFDIVYIVFDAFHAHHAAVYGYERETTPFLSSLVENSIIFDNFYANSPYTLASTGTLFTSQYSHKHGLIKKSKRLVAQYPTLAQMLAERGIETILMTGHVYFQDTWGLDRGFKKKMISRDIHYRKFDLATLQEMLSSIYATDFDQQRFIYIHLMPPHAPYHPPKEYQIFGNNLSFKKTIGGKTFRKLEQGEIQNTKQLLDFIESMYDANIRYADDLARKIYDFYQRKHLSKKTIFIFTSDHGEACRMEHGKMGHTSTLYEEMVHIPLIMKFPDQMNLKGRKIEALCSVVDMAPTLCDLFNIQKAAPFDGKSFFPSIFKENNDRYVYFENFSKDRQQQGIRFDKFKYIRTKNKTELFDLEKDPFETKNIVFSNFLLANLFDRLISIISRKEMINTTQQVDVKSLHNSTLNQLRELGYLH